MVLIISQKRIIDIYLYLFHDILVFRLTHAQWTVLLTIFPPRNGIDYGTKYAQFPSKWNKKVIFWYCLRELLSK